MDRHPFRAMGTWIELLGPADHPGFHEAAATIERIFAREERRFSRFTDRSELSAVNRSAGGWTRVSDGFAALVDFALRAAAETEGRFDPTVLGAVVAAGYDRDLDELLAGARTVLRPAAPGGRWREIELIDQRLRLPAGVGLDLGGVAKGWTVDLAALTVVEDGLPWAAVNAGGDLRFAGSAPTLEVAVEDPERPNAEIGRLHLSSGALATSCTTRRSWGPGLHHLIDPTTGRPSTAPVVQATVWAETCAQAEVAAKAALLEGRRSLGRGAALLVLRDATVRSSFPGEAVA